jgi:hypothetical protein
MRKEKSMKMRKIRKVRIKGMEVTVLLVFIEGIADKGESSRTLRLLVTSVGRKGNESLRGYKMVIYCKIHTTQTEQFIAGLYKCQSSGLAGFRRMSHSRNKSQFFKGTSRNIVSNVVVELVALLLCIREIPVSNLGPEAECPEVPHGFLQSLEANAGIVTENRSRRLPSVFPIHYHSMLYDLSY